MSDYIVMSGGVITSATVEATVIDWDEIAKWSLPAVTDLLVEVINDEGGEFRNGIAIDLCQHIEKRIGVDEG